MFVRRYMISRQSGHDISPQCHDGSRMCPDIQVYEVAPVVLAVAICQVSCVHPFDEQGHGRLCGVCPEGATRFPIFPPPTQDAAVVRGIETQQLVVDAVASGLAFWEEGQDIRRSRYEFAMFWFSDEDSGSAGVLPDCVRMPAVVIPILPRTGPI